MQTTKLLDSFLLCKLHACSGISPSDVVKLKQNVATTGEEAEARLDCVCCDLSTQTDRRISGLRSVRDTE